MQENTNSIRKHVRHVTGIPIEITVDCRQTHYAAGDDVTNVSVGGICFIAGGELEMQKPIQVRFPVLDRETIIDGKVVWCHRTDRGFEIGLEFDDPVEVESLRMIDQVCQIENFRKEVELIDGRKLSGEQAAREWSRRYAGEFSALN